MLQSCTHYFPFKSKLLETLKFQTYAFTIASHVAAKDCLHCLRDQPQLQATRREITDNMHVKYFRVPAVMSVIVNQEEKCEIKTALNIGNLGARPYFAFLELLLSGSCKKTSLSWINKHSFQTLQISRSRGSF